ncbi:HNH endonuclease signature motif containing protein [Reichenbachiella versicolor]|uniref:HNH endonuclease signature motif containing protein n=1 Tax=Reichenbachiella versicolor TaxID=1821036 RepID=UPI000D6DEB59|nr:endonuclease [Reichenbachiella versicolor]
MKNIIGPLILITILTRFGQSQPPLGYYDRTIGKTGYELKTSLYDIINKHKKLKYNDLWTAFEKTDTRKDTIIDMYTLPPLNTVANPFYYKYQIDQCGENKNSKCYNREHSFPASWFGNKKNSPMYTDLFHIYPTDVKINNLRGNVPYDQVTEQNPPLSQNGSKKGYASTNKILGSDIVVFEPIDKYKGDFARTYFYMATCYQDKIAGWANNGEAKYVLAGNDSTSFQDWYVDLLLDWHKGDPVSEKETKRNNAVYLIQNNRNPFIDSAQFVTRIWGTD